MARGSKILQTALSERDAQRVGDAIKRHGLARVANALGLSREATAILPTRSRQHPGTILIAQQRLSELPTAGSDRA